MPESDVKALISAIKDRWSGLPDDKTKRYVGQFFNTTRRAATLTAQVVGNYGTYIVSIQIGRQGLSSACSCYIGKGGNCHHCHALAITFLNDPDMFREITPVVLNEVESLPQLEEYLQGTTLASLLNELKTAGITQKAFSESIGMNTRHLSVIKSSELRNRYHNELGATKLACLWVLEHISKD